MCPPDCPGCGLPPGHCDCGALQSEEERARWEEAYSHALSRCVGGCDGWFPASALTLGHCAYCVAAKAANPEVR